MRIRLKQGHILPELERMFPGEALKHGGKSRLVVYARLGTGRLKSIGSLLKTGEFQFTQLGETMYNYYNVISQHQESKECRAI